MSGPEGPGGPDDVGSVGEEAAKLFGALAGWAREQGADTAQGLGGLAGAAASAAAGAAAGLGEHLDTGAPECDYCPICRTVHVLRTTSPEVRAHLTAAASSFLQAAAGFVASLPQGGAPSPSASDFERIDLDADDDLSPADHPESENPS